MRRLSIFNPIYWQAIKILVEASIFRQHKNSFMGAAWGLVQPFVHITIISFVFSFLLKQPAEIMVKNLVASLPFWAFILASANASSQSLITRRDIIRRVIIPKTMLPITDILVHGYTLLYSFTAMYAAFILFFPHNFSLSILFMPVVATPLITAVILLGIVVAYLTPYVQDIPHIINVILNAIYWALPIVYPYEMVPESKRWLFEINPLFHLLRPIQCLIANQAWPGNILMLKAGLVTCLCGLICYYVHKRLSRNVVYYL